MTDENKFYSTVFLQFNKVRGGFTVVKYLNSVLNEYNIFIGWKKTKIRWSFWTLTESY